MERASSRSLIVGGDIGRKEAADECLSSWLDLGCLTPLSFFLAVTRQREAKVPPPRLALPEGGGSGSPERDFTP